MPVESKLCAFVPFPVAMAAVCFVVCVFILNFFRAQKGGCALIDSAARLS